MLLLLSISSVIDVGMFMQLHFMHACVCLCLCLLQLLKHGSTAVLWEPDMLQVMEAAERRGLKELNGDAAQALRLLLSQVQPLVVSTHENTNKPKIKYWEPL